MDPGTFIFLIMSLISAGITIGDSIKQDAEEARINGQLIDTGEVKKVLDSALSQASSKASDKLENVLNKIQKLDFIQQSPTLLDVIERAKIRLRKKENSLRSDINELNKISIDNQYSYDKANTGVDSSNVKEKLDNYKKETELHNEKVQEIEQRL